MEPKEIKTEIEKITAEVNKHNANINQLKHMLDQETQKAIAKKGVMEYLQGKIKPTKPKNKPKKS